MAASSRKVIYAALAGNLLIAITKFVAAAVTGSSAMLSEGIHSLVDTGNQVLLLHGMRQAGKPPDARFPFGYGKEIYFWSFVVAILIFAVGAGVSVYEGVVHLRHPVAMENPLVNYVVLGLAMAFEGVSWLIALKEFSRAKGRWGYVEAVHRGKDPTLFVVLFEDSAAMLGLLLALAGVGLSHWTGQPWFDGLASILIGCILGGTAVWLAYETKGLLIGESANERVVAGIRAIAGEFPQVSHVNEVLTMHMGPDDILVNLSIDFRDDLSAGELEEVIARLDARIKAAFPEVKRVFVEAEARRTLRASTTRPAGEETKK
ncbi:MAG TPA: cation transporter [Gammaproteobacteria bacterium]|nr:cation transporter [Gammaproteobacteria bacterium]